MNTLKEFPSILRGLRIAAGISQKAVAEKMGVSYQSYQAYERGKAYPSLTNFVLLADIFDVSLDYLVGRKEF